MDVLVIGAGASGLICAMEAGRRRRRVMVTDHSPAPGRKLLLTGGGRCNFTNTSCDFGNFVSRNPHFCKSALSRFTNHDFIEMVRSHGIPFSERDHGRLFCDGSADELLRMLLNGCREAGVAIRLGAEAGLPERIGDRGFSVDSGGERIVARSLVVATGGLSMPSSGAGPFGYSVAEHFGIRVHATRPGLVPFTLRPADRAVLSPLSGISVEAGVAVGRTRFRDSLLFTHRGLSGPAALQASLYWEPGGEIVIDLLPELDLSGELAAQRGSHPGRKLRNAISLLLPRRLVDALMPGTGGDRPLGECSAALLLETEALFREWRLLPAGTEGYGTAEVTLGGVDCDAVSSRTMEARDVPGLYFIGEVLDVTGQLGGYNLQWAWSSGWCAGQFA
jgi:predicted Rossmann fold flavoprotein